MTRVYIKKDLLARSFDYREAFWHEVSLPGLPGSVSGITAYTALTYLRRT